MKGSDLFYLAISSLGILLSIVYLCMFIIELIFPCSIFNNSPQSIWMLLVLAIVQTFLSLGLIIEIIKEERK